jgi:hypothetical protein
MNLPTPTQDPRIDRLNNLLPAIYRIRDAAQQYPLQALLRVMAEQVNLVEDDITQLYQNWFIETCEDWVVPYIGDLVGYTPVSAAGLPSDDATAEGRKLNRVLIPRREVANTIRCRRRKGTLAVLDLLANDVAGWPSRAVEFYKLLAWNQNINHQHPHRARTVDVRDLNALHLLGGPFDALAHSVNVRRIDSHRTVGRHNIPSVGVFIWRLNAYSSTHSAPFCVEEAGPNRFTFSVLGQDAPLFINPAPEASSTQIPGPLNLPGAISRWALHRDPGAFYGTNKSFSICVVDPSTTPASSQEVTVNNIVAADLSDWQYVPTGSQVAVDPVLGRFVFPPTLALKKQVRVTYHYGFSADIGGGEYDRPILDPVAPNTYYCWVNPNSQTGTTPNCFPTITAACQAWISQSPKPPDAVVQIVDSGVYTEQLSLTLLPGESLQIRAAPNKRPTLRLLNWRNDAANAMSVTMGEGSSFTLDGLLITGRPVAITGPAPPPATGNIATSPTPTVKQTVAPVCGAEVIIRHCTLVPGWGLDCGCMPQNPTEPSLELTDVRAHVRIQHSILGSIQLQESARTYDPIPVTITDSILDATDPKKEALGAPGLAVANATLTMKRCTVFGIVNVHAIAMAENCIFNNCLNVARRQLGCMRFCYIPYGCRTPRQYNCQPALVVQAVEDPDSPPVPALTPAQVAARIACEQLRVQPQFTSIRYGTPGYCQLGPNCAAEITGGADDESEMGVFHDLFQPQREANLLARLDDYTPAGMDVGIIHAT